MWIPSRVGSRWWPKNHKKIKLSHTNNSNHKKIRKSQKEDLLPQEEGEKNKKTKNQRKSVQKKYRMLPANRPEDFNCGRILISKTHIFTFWSSNIENKTKLQEIGNRINLRKKLQNSIFKTSGGWCFFVSFMICSCLLASSQTTAAHFRFYFLVTSPHHLLSSTGAIPPTCRSSQQQSSSSSLSSSTSQHHHNHGAQDSRRPDCSEDTGCTPRRQLKPRTPHEVYVAAEDDRARGTTDDVLRLLLLRSCCCCCYWAAASLLRKDGYR